MLRPVIALLFVLATGTSGAEVYRWIDAQGRTHFSDRPPAEPGARIVGAGAVPTDPDPSETPAVDADGPILGPYRAFTILVPPDAAVLSQPTDTLSISLLLDPPLLDGQRLEIVLDGQPTGVAPGSTTLVLPGIGFGAHRLQARVQDANGADIARTAVQSLELVQANPPGVLP
jgi:hypothetical protein